MTPAEIESELFRLGLLVVAERACEERRASLAEVLGRGRELRVTEARRLVVLVLRASGRTGASGPRLGWKEIGRLVGRDHTTAAALAQGAFARDRKLAELIAGGAVDRERTIAAAIDGAPRRPVRIDDEPAGRSLW